MASDLISRSALVNTILTENQRCITSTGHEMSISMICDFILNHPKAYDVDAVVEELEKEKTICFLTDANTGNEVSDLVYRRVYSALDKAIEIVKEGGVNE